MNRFLFISLGSLIAFYFISLTISFATAFIFFIITIITMVAATYKEVDRKRKVPYLKLVK